MTFPPLAQFAKTEYWFSVFSQPLKTLPLYVALGSLVVAVLTAIGSALFTNYLEKKGANRRWIKFCQRLEGWGWAVTIIGAVVVFFSAQGARLLGMRAWLGVWALWSVSWLGFILYEGIITIPKELRKHQDELVRNQYLPKKNK